VVPYAGVARDDLSAIYCLTETSIAPLIASLAFGRTTGIASAVSIECRDRGSEAPWPRHEREPLFVRTPINHGGSKSSDFGRGGESEVNCERATVFSNDMHYSSGTVHRVVATLLFVGYCSIESEPFI
jgi:hypothetical protein